MDGWGLCEGGALSGHVSSAGLFAARAGFHQNFEVSCQWNFVGSVTFCFPVSDFLISADVLKIFTRFLDVKGLILQDFLLMFGAETASRFPERWTTSFKEKVIQEARSLKGSTLLRKCLKAALNEESDTPEEPEWDADMASLLVLLHLLTPQPAGRK
ncbi:hypothetical protein OJAV_G00121130 [Oryzias javanicus]|uniref:Uncharacterized protein n=1 Tax=Oryzias javanicus TaxID=123683 RepID=A0A3S2P6T6_ORYJA|nr:hypothetical protein OJAV_G00121130 [Oryzias javanicus]